MYYDFEKAIHFATKTHQGQKLKNEDINVIFHPLLVGMMIIKFYQLCWWNFIVLHSFLNCFIVLVYKDIAHGENDHEVS